MRLKISIDNKIFTATLNDSETSHEFVKLLPLDITMHEHNNNEKYYNLSKSIPGRISYPGKIVSGDIMIWSSSTLVLFYKNFSSSYSYISLGKIDNTSGFAEVLGTNSVKVKFEIDKTKTE